MNHLGYAQAVSRMSDTTLLVEPLSPCELDAARAALRSLTPRERDVVRAMGNGLTAAETADVLSIARKTVDLHRANIFRKFGVGGALHVIRVAVAVRFSVLMVMNLNLDPTALPLIG